MSLFQTSVLNKYLKTLDDAKVKASYQKFISFFHDEKVIQNIKNDKEEQFQYGFIQKLFDEVLDYTINPNPEFNITTEFKNLKGSKKADGAILKDGKAIGVIELKSTKTKELSKITDQAFGYKNNHPTCNYVITSNFEKLRFYINDAVEYIDFDLFALSEVDFKLLYLCLQKDNILSGLPLKIKEESTVKEEDITKQLYKDYSAFKKTLFNDMVLNNPTIDKMLLFEKSQKLLDRFLFILFAEDKGLLPPNSISEIIQRYETLKAEDFENPLYDIFKQYFGYIDKGRPAKGKKAEIFAFNGGLFKPDNILDNVVISDGVLMDHTKTLTAYDFDSEVDVNILGHIFEHSLNDIEQMAAELSGKVMDKSKSKRKKDGVFYTPKYITKYIVDNTVGKLAENKKEELGFVESEYIPKRTKAKKEKLLKLLDEYREYLLSLTICDPACGSGAFLNQALDYLISEHKYIDELQTKLLGGSFILSDISNDILERNIYGVDINNESVDIARLSLWLKTAQKGRTLTTLNDNIKCGNSLIDDSEVAGNKAFIWRKEFPEVFADGGFDVIIGNPPYVRVQFLPYNEIDFYKEKKVTAFKRVDISTLFFEQSYHLLKQNGKLSFITSNQFQTTEYGEETRRFLSEKFRIEKILDFGDLPVFEGALTYVSIYSISKNLPNNFLYKKVKSIDEAKSGNYENFIEILIKNIDNKKWALVSKEELGLLQKLGKFEKLGNKGNAWAGLFTGLDELLMFDHEGMKNSEIEEGLFLPIIRANDPIRNGLAEPSKYVIYPYKEEENKTIVYTEEELKTKFPKGYIYLNEHKERLQARKDSRKTFKDRKDWFALTRYGRKNIFNQPKIVSPGEVKDHKFSLDNSGSGFSCARVFAITVDDSLSILALLSILNSKLIKFFLQRKSSLKAGGYYSYSSKVLNEVPLPSKINEDFESTIQTTIELNKALSKHTDVFINFLQSKFEGIRISRKIENWYSIEFIDFQKELKKQKMKLSLSNEAEWMQYFNEQKEKAQNLKLEINKIDGEIDEMVYRFYGLTVHEIAIVENLI